MLIFKIYSSYITLMIRLLFRAKAEEQSGGELFQLIEQNEIPVSSESTLADPNVRRCFYQCGLQSACRYVLSNTQNGYCKLANSPSVNGKLSDAGSQLWKKIGKMRFCKISITRYNLSDRFSCFNV